MGKENAEMEDDCDGEKKRSKQKSIRRINTTIMKRGETSS
jgi:hypothetical protein